MGRDRKLKLGNSIPLSTNSSRYSVAYETRHNIVQKEALMLGVSVPPLYYTGRSLVLLDRVGVSR